MVRHTVRLKVKLRIILRVRRRDGVRPRVGVNLMTGIRTRLMIRGRRRTGLEFG